MQLSSAEILLSALLVSTSVEASPSRYDARTEPSTNILDCLNSHNVSYAIKSSANWTALSTPFNLRLVYEPAVITIPETPDHVSASVTCAAAAYLKVQAKSGGHSYASYSSGGQNGSLIVDLQKFDGISVDQCK